MRRNIPNPDGRPGYRRPEAPYGPQWVAERRARELLRRYDKIIQFVEKVAAKTSTSVDRWWTGAVGDNAALEMMVSNVLNPQTTTSMATGAGGSEGFSTLDPLLKERIKASLDRAADVGDAKFLQQVRELEAAVLAKAAGVTAPVKGPDGKLTIPRTQEDWDRLKEARFYERAADKDKDKSSKDDKSKKDKDFDPWRTPGRPVLTTFSTTAALSTSTSAALSSSSEPAAGSNIPLGAPRPRRLPIHRAVDDDELERKQLDERQRADAEQRKAEADKERELDAAKKELDKFKEKLAKKDALGTFDSKGRPVYGLDDPLMMAMHLMLDPSTTQTQLNLLSWIYNIPELSKAALDAKSAASVAGKGMPQTPEQAAMTPEGRLKYARDLVAMQKLIHGGEGGPDWAEAPQHTGYVFFDSKFAAAVRDSMTVLRDVCNVGWAYEVDLMTQSRVCDSFSDLVAYYLRKYMRTVASRFVDPRYQNEREESNHGYLLEKFKTLQKFPVPARLQGAAGGTYVLGFAGQRPAEDLERQHEVKMRQAYLATTGKYWGADY